MLPELWGEIIFFTNKADLSLVCQLWEKLNQNNIKKLYIQHFTKLMPSQMIDAFGGVDQMIVNYIHNKYQLLKIDRCCDYIDFIQPKMMTSSIMIGIDPYQRRYISLKYINQQKKENVVTLFQRYTHENSWRGCGHYNSDFAFDTSYGSLDYNLLQKFVNGNEIELLHNQRIVKLNG